MSEPVTLAYEKAEAKKERKANIIAIHGLLGTSDVFKSLAESPELTDFCDVYLVETRSHGKSPRTESNTCQDAASDIVFFIQQHQLKNVILMGHCFGGKICMKVNEMEPSMVKGIIFVEIAPVDTTIEDPSSCHIYNDPLQSLQYFSTFDFRKLNTLEKVEAALMEHLPKKEKIPFIDYIIANIATDPQTGVPGWHVPICSILAGIPSFQKYRPSTPSQSSSLVFAVVGNQSSFVPENGLQALKETYPIFKQDIDYVILEGGHFIHLDNTEGFLRAVQSFLSRVLGRLS